MLSEIAAGPGIELQEGSYGLKFKELIINAAKERKAVLLIDEYEKPIIDYLEDVPRAEANREILSKALEARDAGGMLEAINTTFSSIPYDLWQKENEHFYHAPVHLVFSLLGTYAALRHIKNRTSHITN